MASVTSSTTWCAARRSSGHGRPRSQMVRRPALVAAADVPGRVVADHPAAVREAGAAAGRCEFEEAHVRLAHLQVAGDRDTIYQVGDAGCGKLGALDVGPAVGSDADRPCSVTEADQSLEDGLLAGDGASHEVDVFLPELCGGLGQSERPTEASEVDWVRAIGQLDEKPLLNLGPEFVPTAQAGDGVTESRVAVDESAVEIEKHEPSHGLGPYPEPVRRDGTAPCLVRSECSWSARPGLQAACVREGLTGRWQPTDPLPTLRALVHLGGAETSRVTPGLILKSRSPQGPGRVHGGSRTGNPSRRRTWLGGDRGMQSTRISGTPPRATPFAHHDRFVLALSAHADASLRSWGLG